MEVTGITAGKEETTVIRVDTMETADKGKIIFMVEATEVDTTVEADALGMETEVKIKMIIEIIVTIMTVMTIETTESNMKTDNRIDKFCPDLESFWTNLSQKTCRGEGDPCDWPPPLQSIARKCNEKD